VSNNAASFCYLFIEMCIVIVFVLMMSSLCIRSSRYLFRTLVTSKCYMLSGRQICRINVGTDKLGRLTKFVGVSGLAGVITSLVLYNSHSIKLHAQRPDISAYGPKQWNFIADVVEKVSPAVVYIEVDGRYAACRIIRVALKQSWDRRRDS